MVTPVTELLAKFVAETDYPALSPKAVENAKLHILDTFGAALAGYEHPIARIALDYCHDLAGPPEVTIWGSAVKAPVPMGAFTNGILAHAIDYDDWDAVAHVGHPSCMVVSSSLALGEALGASGKDFLRGYAVGIEVGTQISAACPTDIHSRGFHSTPIFGSMASTASAASMLRLSPEKVRAAFGIAASGAGGLHRQQGSMVKPFHAANTARDAVEAALLAQRGFTADPSIIESPRGFCDSFFGASRCDYDKMLQGLGAPFYLESPGLSFKLHPCSAPQFLAADATLHLVREHDIIFDNIESVELRVNRVRYERHFRSTLQSGLQGKFTINYVCAIALLDRRLQRSSFYDAKARDPRVLEAMGKVNVVIDEAIPEEGEYCPVTIALKDGRKFQHTATVQKGHTKNPLTEAEVLSKFRDNAAETISDAKCAEIIACVRRLETIINVRELTQLLAA